VEHKMEERMILMEKVTSGVGDGFFLS